MHADDFREDRYGVVSGLRDGGYSDDMTLAAIAGNSFLHIVIALLLQKKQYLVLRMEMKYNPVISILCLNLKGQEL